MMFDFSTLITDRSLADVERVSYLAEQFYSGAITESERAEFLSDLKGAYNHTDLNRVSLAMYELVSILESYGYIAEPLTSRTDWANGDIPTQSDFASFLSDVAKVRKVLTVPEGTPKPISDIKRLDYNTANNLEKILLTVNSLFPLIDASFIYSGEAYSGEI